MKPEDVRELQFIAPIENLWSIVSEGIMSHERAGSRPHRSVADNDVQTRRDAKHVPPSQRGLHTFANLYLNARNAMMFRLVRAIGPDALCVVRIDPMVLQGEGVVIADRNAATSSCSFYASPEGLARIEARDVFCDWWTTADSRHKMMAEVLIPDVVLPELIMGIRVASKPALATAATVVRDSPLSMHIEVDRHMFFPLDSR